jgi:FMN-dependent NADH-azoreductase
MKILHVNASPRNADSRSLAIATYFIEQLKKPKATVINQINLFHDPMPEFGETATAAKMALFTGQQQTTEQISAWADIRAVFDFFADADLYVLNSPLWNNGVPYKLKQFIDLVTQPGWAFGFDPVKGYNGLLKGKKAVIVHASGVWHDGINANFGSDFSTPYLVDWFDFIGVSDVEHIRFQPTVLNADVARTENEAKAQARDIATRLLA